MPLSRYQIRNEYGLGDQQLYKVADKDDPEAILEGVAMAGLVGLLRQLGDLAQFAAEVFHDLHEEVLATAMRGHGLVIRVQQLESEVPLIERALLTQTTHTSFLCNSGIDWHPNLPVDQNLVTRRDLPRFVMDSCKECRGPPRLFLLDKFDVAGAGACLKRYTDPSFFKTESISSDGRKSEGQREKKTRRLRKRAPRWRNCGIPESFPSSHAKLHKLFLEEHLESGVDDPECRVKLKRRQFAGSFLDQDNKTSHMEKFVDLYHRAHNIATATDGCELGLEIIESSAVSPRKESIETDKSLCLSHESRGLEMKASMDGFSGDRGAVKLPGLNHGSETCKALNLVEDEDSMDMENNSQVISDDDFASEIDNYMDAVANIESEVETDSECRKTSCYSNAKHLADFYGSEGQGEHQSLFSDSQSVGNSTTSEDANNFFKERKNSSCSISGNSTVESTTDLDAHNVVAPVSASKLYSDDLSYDRHYPSKGIPGNENEEHARESNGAIEADIIPKSTLDSEETINISCHNGPNTIDLTKDMEASLGENSFPCHKLYKEYSKFPYDGVMANQSAPKRTDYMRWFNVEHSLNDEKSQSTTARPETSHDLPNTLDDLVIASATADLVSPSVVDHHDDLGLNLDACSGIEQSVGAHPHSQEDHSIKKILSDPEAEEEASPCSVVRVTETLPPVSDVYQAHVLEFSQSGLAQAAETADFNYLEGATLGTLSFGDQAGIFGSADESGEQCARNVHRATDSVGENEPDAILHTGSLEKRASVSWNFTVIHHDQSEPVGNANLDDTGIGAIQIDASNLHECCKNHGDKNKDLVQFAFPSGMSSKPSISSKTTSETENNSMDYNVVKVESTEIVANSCREIDVEKDQPVSLAEEYRQNEGQLMLGHNTDAGTQNDIDAAQDAPVNCGANMAINPGQLDSPSFPILDLLPTEPSITLELPPLPPLPPMQWRLGKFLNKPTVTERQIVRHAPGSVQPVAVPTTNVKTEIVVRSPKTRGHQGYSNGNLAEQGVPTPPVAVAFANTSTQIDIIGIVEDNRPFAAAQTLVFSQNENPTLEESCQPSVNPPQSASTADAPASGSYPAVVVDEFNNEFGSGNWQPKHPQVLEQEAVNSDDELLQSATELNDLHSHPGFASAPETESILPSTDGQVVINGDGNSNGTVQCKPQRPRNPLIDEVVAIDKSKLRKVERFKPPVESKGDEAESLLEQLQLRKVGERTKPQVESKTEDIGLLLEQLQLRKVGERFKPEADLKPEETGSPRVQLRKAVGRTHSMIGPKTEDRNSLLEQIRNKSFNLRPAVMARPNVQGPRTNLRVAAILQKASNIRQAMAGSDEEDDADNWSDC